MLEKHLVKFSTSAWRQKSQKHRYYYFLKRKRKKIEIDGLIIFILNP